MVFSGSGRHRRPTQADRAVVAAGVAGAGLALPLLTATGAHAASASTWDAVAQCASGGDWTQESHGSYGGLQITMRNWIAYGGDQYAAEPDHATKQQQIAVAESILADQGPNAWLGCAAAGGLTAAAPASPAPTTSTPSGPTAASPTAGPPVSSTTAQPSAPAAPAPTTATPSAPAPSVPATPAPGTAAPVPATPPSPSAAAPSAPAGAPTAPSTPAPTAPPATDPTTAPDYTVLPDDTLSGISDAHRLGGWQHLYDANQAIIGADPNLIRPGQVLHLH